MLFNILAISCMWTLCACNVTSVATFHWPYRENKIFILFTYNELALNSSHMWLVSTTLNITGDNAITKSEDSDSSLVLYLLTCFMKKKLE